jgi:predicted phosphodiesterase
VKLGVVADIHGNAAALDAVLTDGAEQGVERWWTLGDLVLLGPRPVEVVERRSSGCIYGNSRKQILRNCHAEDLLNVVGGW